MEFAEEALEVPLRPSRGADWLDCSRRAVALEAAGSGDGVVGDGPVPVSAWYGRLVHDGVFPGGPDLEVPRSIGWDGKTRSSSQLRSQVEYGVLNCGRFLAGHRLMESEVSCEAVHRYGAGSAGPGVDIRIRGRADFTYETGSGDLGIGDLKTSLNGRVVRGALVQLALYALLWPDAVECSVLWAPRGQPWDRYRFVRRPASELRPLGREVLDRVRRSWDGSPSENPLSFHCKGCIDLQCPFRRRVDDVS